jgi:hypothetical protein
MIIDDFLGSIKFSDGVHGATAMGRAPRPSQLYGN